MLYSNHNILTLDPIGSGHLEIQNLIQSKFENLNSLNPQSKLNCETLYNQSASHMLPIYSDRANIPIPKGRNRRPQIHRDAKARPNPIETMSNPEAACPVSKALVGSSELEQFGEDLLLLSYHLQCKCSFSWTSSTWCLQLSLIQVQCSRYIQHPTVSDSTHELPSVSLLGI